MTEERPYSVFDAVASNDLEGIVTEYIKNAQTTIVSYLSLRKRWSMRSEAELKEGKLHRSPRVDAQYVFYGVPTHEGYSLGVLC